MTHWSHMIRIKARRLICILILFLSLCTVLLLRSRHRQSRDVVPREHMEENLHKELSDNEFKYNTYIKCNYESVIFSQIRKSAEWDIEIFFQASKISNGGERFPDCKPMFSTAIIVPYRLSNKVEEITYFLRYMHSFLSHQYIHYRIYIIEQLGTDPFNRAKLLNIGAQIAMKKGFPCLIFHDIHLIPLVIANIYACTKNPRHMSTIIRTNWIFNTNPSAPSGVFAIRSSQFRAINGMSNKYYGGGGEDHDLYARLQARNLKICTFEPDISLYYQFLGAKTSYPSADRNKLMAETKESMDTDGLNSLEYTEINQALYFGFTHVMVSLKADG